MTIIQEAGIRYAASSKVERHYKCLGSHKPRNKIDKK